MSLANSIKTHQLDPLYFNQQRCEFRLDPNKAYLSNLRLADLGSTVDGSTDARYPFNVGAYALLQKITLLNDNVEIASLNNVSDYLGFANLQRTNANAYNVSRRLNLSHLGFDIDDNEPDVNITLNANTKRYVIADFTTTDMIPSVVLTGGNAEQQAVMQVDNAVGMKVASIIVAAGGKYADASTAGITVTLDDAKGGTGVTITPNFVDHGDAGFKKIDKVAVSVPGSGFTDVPTLKFSDAGSGNISATAPVLTATNFERRITSISQSVKGVGYRSPPSAVYSIVDATETLNAPTLTASQQNSIHIKNLADNRNIVTSDESTTPRAWLDLKVVLPFLSATPYLLGSEMQNLRLVIEFNQSNVDDILAGNYSGAALKILRPSIIIDEIIQAKGPLKNPNIQYINLDSERVVVQAMGTDDTLQQVNQRLRGFDAKTVHRMLIVNKDTRTNTPLCRKFASHAMYKERFQFILDGMKLLPYQGVNSPAKKLAMLTSAWGGHLSPAGCHAYRMDNLTAALKDTDLAGNFSYGGMMIGQDIDELQLEYQREAYPQNSINITGVSVGAASTIKAPNHGFKADDAIEITGLAGTDAAELNGDRVVLAVPDIDTLTVAGNTTGKAITAAGDVDVRGTTVQSQTANSKRTFDMLFWGEVVKTLNVRDNRVSISF